MSTSTPASYNNVYGYQLSPASKASPKLLLCATCTKKEVFFSRNQKLNSPEKQLKCLMCDTDMDDDKPKQSEVLAADIIIDKYSENDEVIITKSDYKMEDRKKSRTTSSNSYLLFLFLISVGIGLLINVGLKYFTLKHLLTFIN